MANREFIQLLKTYVSALESDVVGIQTSPPPQELVSWSDVQTFMATCQEALAARSQVTTSIIEHQQKSSEEESSFMADQVESLLADKHQLQEQLTSLQRDNTYLEERNEYLQQQLMDRTSSGSLEDDALAKLHHELDLQRVVNKQLQQEVQHLRQRILVEKSPVVSPFLSLAKSASVGALNRNANSRETTPSPVPAIGPQRKLHIDREDEEEQG